MRTVFLSFLFFLFLHTTISIGVGILRIVSDSKHDTLALRRSRAANRDTKALDCRTPFWDGFQHFSSTPLG